MRNLRNVPAQAMRDDTKSSTPIQRSRHIELLSERFQGKGHLNIRDKVSSVTEYYKTEIFNIFVYYPMNIM